MNGDKNNQVTFRIEWPLPDEKIFVTETVSEVLEILINNSEQSFSKSQLQEMTERGWSSIQKTTDILEKLDLITVEEEGNKKLVSINSKNIDRPNNPINSIPQTSFRKPVKRFKDRVMNEIDYVAGIILFGSVARGEADRASDIDMLILVEDNLTEARQKITGIASELQEKKIEGDRYKFESLVESPESVERRKNKIQNIFSEGLVLHKTKKLEELKERTFK